MREIGREIPVSPVDGIGCRDSYTSIHCGALGIPVSLRVVMILGIPVSLSVVMIRSEAMQTSELALKDLPARGAPYMKAATLAKDMEANCLCP